MLTNEREGWAAHGSSDLVLWCVCACSYVSEVEKEAEDKKKEVKKGDEKDGRRRRHNSSSGSDGDSDGSPSPSRGKRSGKGGKKGDKGKAAAAADEDGDSIKKAAEQREAVERAKAKFNDQLLEVDREVSSGVCVFFFFKLLIRAKVGRGWGHSLSISDPFLLNADILPRCLFPLRRTVSPL